MRLLQLRPSKKCVARNIRCTLYFFSDLDLDLFLLETHLSLSPLFLQLAPAEKNTKQSKHTQT